MYHIWFGDIAASLSFIVPYLSLLGWWHQPVCFALISSIWRVVRAAVDDFTWLNGVRLITNKKKNHEFWGF